LSNAGGRLIIASDGIWDALSSEAAAKSCRGLPAELAAKQVVKVNGSKLGYRFLFSLDDASYGSNNHRFITRQVFLTSHMFAIII